MITWGKKKKAPVMACGSLWLGHFTVAMRLRLSSRSISRREVVEMSHNIKSLKSRDRFGLRCIIATTPQLLQDFIDLMLD